MSTTTTKFCVDCKWHGHGPAHLDMCYHPEHGWDYKERTSLVTGELIPGMHKMCGDARHKNHPCGPDGNLWEIKDTKTPWYRKLFDWIHER